MRRVLFAAVVLAWMYGWGEGVATNAWTWYEKDALPMEGRAFSDTETFCMRLPVRAKDVVRPAVYGMSRNSTGLQIRFTTDADRLIVTWKVADPKMTDPLIPAAGLMGLDVYRLENGKWRFSGNKRYEKNKDHASGEAVINWRPDQAGIIYLPIRANVLDIKVGVPVGKTLKAFPHAPGHEKPIVHYGTSIVHGGCVSRSGLVFTSMYGRELDREVINLGFSGNGRMEKELVPFLAEIDAALYVVDCIWNMCDPKVVEERAAPFLEALRASRPDTPILLCEACLQNRNGFGSNTMLRKVYDGLKAADPAKWRNLHYFPYEDMLPVNDEVTHDFCHPNDYGAMFMGPAYAKRIGEVLEKGK